MPRPSVLMLLLAAALAGVIGWELTEAHDARPPEPGAAARPAPPPAAPQARPGAEAAGQARIALARPLFEFDRKPRAALPSPPAAAESLPRLTALLSGPFGRRAIFAAADGRSVALGEGGALGRWTVVSIRPEGVSMSGRDGERTVSLGRGSGVPAVTLAPAAAADADDHAGGELMTRPKAGPMFLSPGDPPAGRR